MSACPRGAMRPRPGRASGGLAGLIAILLAACAPAGPPAIRPGAECAACGMAIEDLRFACERRVDGVWRAYDAIECLVRDGGASDQAWLADYDQRTLAPAESLWVVRGDFPSPMGGGLAAFRDRAAADDIAARTRGRVGRLAEVAAQEGAPR